MIFIEYDESDLVKVLPHLSEFCTDVDTTTLVPICISRAKSFFMQILPLSQVG